MPSKRCGSCRKFISPVEGVRCSKCNLLHHRNCVAIPVKGNVAATWKCLECSKQDPKNNKDTTPDCCTNRDILNEIRAMRLDMRNLHDDISEMKLEVRCCKSRIDELEARLEASEKRGPAQNESRHDVNALINQFRSDLNDRDQELLANDVEIKHIPEEKNENPIDLVIAVAEKLGVNLENRDVVSAERVGGRFLKATHREETMEPLSRVLVVRLARRDRRDELLQKARLHRNINTADMGLPGKPQRIYVNERLTKYNRQLFRLARVVVRKNSWQFLWTKRGHILARQNREDHVPRIRTEADILENICLILDGV